MLASKYWISRRATFSGFLNKRIGSDIGCVTLEYKERPENNSTVVAKLETNAMCGNIDSNGPVVPMIRGTKNDTVHFLFSSGWTRNCDRLYVPHVYYRVCVQLLQDVQ
ncbi:hypothetical protein J6590_092709 [Homalodisca vitripennis]|nr:hypothetical protein J6590_092709 [Homalodisca vitripennis]